MAAPNRPARAAGPGPRVPAGPVCRVATTAGLQRLPVTALRPRPSCPYRVALSPTQVLPTDAAVDALDAGCHAGSLLDPPPGHPAARLWRDGDRPWWTVPTLDSRDIVVLVDPP